jgi:hypothetical protein
MTNDNTRSEIRRLKDRITELEQAIWDINDKFKAVAAVTGGPPRPPQSEVPIRQKPFPYPTSGSAAGYSC